MKTRNILKRLFLVILSLLVVSSTITDAEAVTRYRYRRGRPRVTRMYPARRARLRRVRPRPRVIRRRRPVRRIRPAARRGYYRRYRRY